MLNIMGDDIPENVCQGFISKHMKKKLLIEDLNTFEKLDHFAE